MTQHSRNNPDEPVNHNVSALSERQHEIIRHTLGIRDGKTGYRNHFCTGEGSDDFADCEALVAAGVMGRHTRSWTPDFIYTVIAPHLDWSKIK